MDTILDFGSFPQYVTLEKKKDYEATFTTLKE